MIVSVPLVLLSSSWVPVRVIVCGVAKTVVIEGDGRDSRGIEVGEGDGLTQAQEAGAREEGIARRIHDQAARRPGRCWSERTRRGETRGGRDDGVTAEGVVGRGGDGGLAAGDDGRGGRQESPWRHWLAGLATKLTTPPLTGSTGLLAVTVTASGLANGVPMFAVCGVLPATTREGEALALEGADVDGADPAQAALVGGGDAGATGVRRRSPGCRAAGPWSGSGRRSCPAGPAAG